jgi:hypothetical protein
MVSSVELLPTEVVEILWTTSYGTAVIVSSDVIGVRSE